MSEDRLPEVIIHPWAPDTLKATMLERALRGSGTTLVKQTRELPANVTGMRAMICRHERWSDARELERGPKDIERVDAIELKLDLSNGSAVRIETDLAFIDPDCETMCLTDLRPVLTRTSTVRADELVAIAERTCLRTPLEHEEAYEAAQGAERAELRRKAREWAEDRVAADPAQRMDALERSIAADADEMLRWLVPEGMNVSIEFVPWERAKVRISDPRACRATVLATCEDSAVLVHDGLGNGILIRTGSREGKVHVSVGGNEAPDERQWRREPYLIQVENGASVWVSANDTRPEKMHRMGLGAWSVHVAEGASAGVWLRHESERPAPGGTLGHGRGLKIETEQAMAIGGEHPDETTVAMVTAGPGETVTYTDAYITRLDVHNDGPERRMYRITMDARTRLRLHTASR